MKTQIETAKADLPVELKLLLAQAGQTSLLVKAGKFVLFDGEYELTEDEEFVLTPRDEISFVTGFLVQDKQSKEVRVLFDECYGGRFGLNFDEQGKYRLLHQLVYFQIPAGTSSLDDIEVKLYHQGVVEDAAQSS